MSSYEGLTQLTDHHRLYNFSALHRRSDSVESHGSVSSLSSNHSSVGGRNGGGPSSSGPSEMSRFRRVDPPRTLNTGGCSPSRNAFHQRDGTPRSSQSQVALLHSTSVMEAPSRQQTLNRSRSGSCPMVWVPNGSLHPVDGAKPHLPQSNQWVYSPFAYSPRHPDRPLCGQVTGSVQYVGSQHDDCRALGGARMPQGPSFPLPNRRSGNAAYNGLEPHERYPSEQSLTDYVRSPGSGLSMSSQRPRLSAYAVGRTGDRCPSEQNLSDLAQSPSVVTSALQRSLSTMSVNVAPNNNFTSKLNCSLSQSFTSKLNDVAQKADEGVRLRKDLSKSGKQNFASPQSPYEMGLCFNVPQAGRVRRQREAFEKEASTAGSKQEAAPLQTNAAFGNRSQFKHRSFENLSPASKKYSLGSAFAFGDGRQENQWNSRGDVRRNAKMSAWTPDEDKLNSRVNAHDPPDEVRSKGSLNAVTPGEARHNNRLHGCEKRDSLDLTLTPNDSRRGSRQLPVESPASSRTGHDIPTNRNLRSNQLSASTSHENIHKRPANLPQFMENRPNGPTSFLEGRPSRSLHALSAKEPRRQDNSPSGSSFADRLRKISRNSSSGSQSANRCLPSSRSLFAAAISDMEQENLETSGSQPLLTQPSTFVSEVYVSIVKPRPSSGLPREQTVSLQPLVLSPSLSSPIYDNLPVNSSLVGSSASRSSLPLAGAGTSDRTLGEKAPWASASTAAASTRRHSNPTEKVTETSPAVQGRIKWAVGNVIHLCFSLYVKKSLNDARSF